MGSVMDVISSETGCKNYSSYKYSFDASNVSSIDYDDSQEITWEDYGETIPPEKSKSLKSEADSYIGMSALFSYFLDGSRRTYKVDDIALKNQVFPVIAGQVGISCCKREEMEMKYHDYERRIVITLPKTICKDEWTRKQYFANLKKKINENAKNLIESGVEFTDVLSYSTKKDEFERIESKGIAVIQDLMIDREIDMVTKMVAAHKINQNNYLLKDGSLEYRVDHLGSDRELRKFQSNFRYVVGVSKSFNPENCKDKKGKNNSNMIANLPLYHRTPVSMYSSPRLKGMRYAVWYIRVRDKRYTTNAFDGILKVEKILVTDQQIKDGLDTEEVDLISANLINERNPVCYGADSRWANHLYPVYVTECFAKSKYLSNTMFLNLF